MIKICLKLFEGKLSNNSKFYRASMKDQQKIKDYYKILIPFLTAREFNLNHENFNDKKIISPIIQDFYVTELKEELDLDYAQEQLLCKFAEDLTKNDSFNNDQTYLEKLFKKALVKLKVHYYELKLVGMR